MLTDDEGFGAASAFGGPVPTPNLERLAKAGLSYTRFHTTAMCSPTRASLLTGRNHHAVNMGTLTEFAQGSPGYTSVIPDSAATVARILKGSGYSTAFFGKHHNIPIGQDSPAGPFDKWPTGLGFEYFFGFTSSDTDQWRPTLYRGTNPVPVDKDPRILDERLASDAIGWLHNQKAAAPEKPFLIYFAPGSTHTPHQAPADWIERFRGRFANGWDRVREETLARQKAMGIVPARTRLPAWPADLPRWSQLSAEDRKVQERYMEVYAAMLAFQDEQIGRLLNEVDRMGLAANTMVIWISGDNGADAAAGAAGSLSEKGEIANRHSTLAERVAALDQFGGPEQAINYSAGWALAMNAPFPFYKQIASHLGGTRNGAVISWPAMITGRGIRGQYHHVIDILPTILKAAKVQAPAFVDGVRQQPIDGVAMEYSFNAPTAPDRRTTQYYEMLGNRAIYHDGWLASTTPLKRPWEIGFGPTANENLTARYGWELYDLRSDFSQSKDVAARFPDRLKSMQLLFETEAAKYQVNPLDDRTSASRTAGIHKAYVIARDHYTFWGTGISLAPDLAPQMGNRTFIVDADVVVQPGSTDGVILANGSRLGGWSFYVKDGRPAVMHLFSQLPGDQFVLSSPAPLPTARPSHIRFAFSYLGGGYGKGGDVSISIDGKPVASAPLARSIVVPAGHGETFDIGHDRGVTVTGADVPNSFPGAIDKIEVRLGPVGKAWSASAK
ncbi:arylsulfatase [Tardibacter chloracetimidivorans]|uniref:Arylsulfatase n=1 Tax=Tardibacter chloracetimidivorans TaxID=1921510 RepID=A0A1L3ZZP3_9SPHN|nr:arylsulfatase [Tardibacter chloracetimidivorans]